MGDMLYLAKSDYTDTDSKVDLINGVLRLRRGSWEPRIGQVGGARVVETMDLASDEANAALLAELANVEELLEHARTYPLNPVQAEGTWLEWGIDAEPRVSAEEGYASKRAWVYGGSLELGGGKNLPGAFLNNRAAARLAIERHPLWENLEDVTDNFVSIAWGDVTDLTGLQTEMGTAPGRIAIFYSMTQAHVTNVQEYWIGLRSENEGWSEFDPLWELENGTNGTDTSDAVDATASGGNRITCSFATDATLVQRSSISTNQAHSGTTDWHDFLGQYMVLLRAKVGSSTECGVQLTIGGPSDSDYGAKCEEVYIDNTDWKLIELGQVTFPPHGYREGVGGNLTGQYTTFFLNAERLSGSGWLYMDCLYLIPADHYLHAYGYEDAELFLSAYVFPTDEHDFLMRPVGTSEYTSSYDISWKDWVLPTDIAMAVVTGQTLTAHSLTETFYISFEEWYPRWRLYRSV